MIITSTKVRKQQQYWHLSDTKKMSIFTCHNLYGESWLNVFWRDDTKIKSFTNHPILLSILKMLLEKQKICILFFSFHQTFDSVQLIKGRFFYKQENVVKRRYFGMQPWASRCWVWRRWFSILNNRIKIKFYLAINT